MNIHLRKFSKYTYTFNALVWLGKENDLKMEKQMTFNQYIQPDIAKCEFLVSRKAWWRVRSLYEHEYIIWKYQLLLRKEEYYADKGGLWKFLSAYYRRQKNILGSRLGFTIHKHVFGPGLRIWHYGNVVVNAYARVGRNCSLHGDNCIGNNGFGGASPRIGDNVDIGVGAKIIGDITIANNVIIGAGAVVNRSILEENVVVAGVPAKIIKRL